MVFGTEEQKRRFLPPLIEGEEKACFAVTEPDAGLDTTKLKTRAVRDGNGYVVHGQKIWISTAQVADRVLLLARTTPLEEVKKPTQGLSLFYTELDRKYVEVREIDKMGRKAVDSNQLFFDGLPVPLEDRIGEEGKGFEYILHGMNPERILIAAEAVGHRPRRARARRALRQGARRVRPADRPEPGDPASAGQVLDGARGGQPDGVQGGRASTTRASRAASRPTPPSIWRRKPASRACETAVMTHGGMGYAKEYHVERYLREVLIARIAPVTPQLILCHIAEKALGLPKSY